MTNDRQTLAELGLDQLRIGDILAVRDHDHTQNRGYREGAITIGIINHADSFMTGHGPGVMDLLSCATAKIEPVIDNGPIWPSTWASATTTGQRSGGRARDRNERRPVDHDVGDGRGRLPGYPGIPAIPHQIDRDGKPRLLPMLGGIVYNVKLGDSVYGWAGDMIEPGVAIKAPRRRPTRRSTSSPASATRPW